MNKFVRFFYVYVDGVAVHRYWTQLFLCLFMLLLTIEHGLGDWRGYLTLLGAMVYAISTYLSFQQQKQL